MYGECRGLVTSQPVEIHNSLIEFKILRKQPINSRENHRILSPWRRPSGKNAPKNQLVSPRKCKIVAG